MEFRVLGFDFNTDKDTSVFFYILNKNVQCYLFCLSYQTGLNVKCQRYLKGFIFSAGVKIALDLASRQALLGSSGAPKEGLLAGDTRALVVQSLYRLLGLLFLFSEYWLKCTGEMQHFKLFSTAHHQGGYYGGSTGPTPLFEDTSMENRQEMPGFSAQFGQFAGNEFLQGPMANVAVGYGAQMANQGKEYVEKHVSLKFFCPCSNIIYDEMQLPLNWRLDLVAEILASSCIPLIAKWYFSHKNILIYCSCNFLLFFFSD